VKAETRTQRIERCQAAVDAKPDSAVAHYNLGLAYQKAGRFRQAEEVYAKTVEMEPELTEAWVNLGGVRLHLWDFDGCLEASEKAAEQRDDLLIAHYNLGQAHLYLNHPEDLLACMERVLEIDRNHAAAHYHAAIAQLALGNPGSARRHAEKASVLGHRPTPDFLKALDKADAKAAASKPQPVQMFEITGRKGPEKEKEE
jgi:tetratricopeptide (TPR) repeat protein